MTARVEFFKAVSGTSDPNTMNDICKLQVTERLLAIRRRIRSFLGSCKARYLLNQDDANYIAALSAEANSINAEIESIAKFINEHYNWTDRYLLRLDNGTVFNPGVGLRNVGSENSPSFSKTVEDAFFYCTGTQYMTVLGSGTERTRIYTTKTLSNDEYAKTLGIVMRDGNSPDKVEVPIRFQWFLQSLCNSVATIKDNPFGEQYPKVRVRNSIINDSSYISTGTDYGNSDAYLGYVWVSPDSGVPYVVEGNTLELAFYVFDHFFSANCEPEQAMECSIAYINACLDHIKKVTALIDADSSEKVIKTVNWNVYLESSQFQRRMMDDRAVSGFKSDLYITDMSS